MFTIKHIAPNGDEFAIQAESYEVTRERGGDKPDFIRVMTYDEKYRDGNYTGFWAGTDEGGPGSHCLFIMNRHGATVSKIHFKDAPADYWGAQESEAQAA